MVEHEAGRIEPLSVISRQADHYQKCCCRNARAHYICSDLYQRRHLYLGVPAIVISTIVGTTIFASISSNSDFTIKLMSGALSIVAASLAALQTFMDFEEKSKEHKASGNKFSALRREFELYLIYIMGSNTANHAERVQMLRTLTDKFSDISSEVPKVPERQWRQANKEVPVLDAHLSPVALAIAAHDRGEVTVSTGV